MKLTILKYLKVIWNFYKNKFRIPYPEFVFILYFSLQLFIFVAIPEKELTQQFIGNISIVMVLFMWLDCIKSWLRYFFEIHGEKDKRKLLILNILKFFILCFPILMNIVEKMLSNLIIPDKNLLNTSQLGLIYVLFVLICSLIFMIFIVLYSIKSGFWTKGWVSLLLTLYMFLAYSFSLIFYIGDYYHVSKGNGFSFSEKIQNEILVRNVQSDFNKELLPFQESAMARIITEKENKLGYTVIDVEGNDLKITSDKIGENWAAYYYEDLIQHYNLFSVLSMENFKFTPDLFKSTYSDMDYNILLNGNYKLLKIALYELPSEKGSILKYENNGEYLDQYLKKYMYLIVSEENVTNYLIFESQRNNHVLLTELLSFSNVLLDNTISDINMIIHEGISKSFFDYFYYSFVVITTLGFGDITPISQLFRGLTILEAILGLIIMGLFLAKVFDSKK